MEHQNPEMLLRIAQADAYASATEYIKLPENQATLDACLKFAGYVSHPLFGQPGETRMPAGFYSDDTEMSCANAWVLCRGVFEHPPFYADAYVEEFRRGGQRKGYSKRLQAFLESVRDGREFLKRIIPDSTGNGAAMRAVPFGVLPDIPEVLKAATVQASVTHDTPEGRFSARAVALMSHFAHRESEAMAFLPTYCLDFLPPEDTREFGRVFLQEWDDRPVKAYPGFTVAEMTVHAVVELLVRGRSLMEIIELAIRWGGDTDTVAAIAWGIASARFRDEKLPEFLERDLEGGSSLTGAPYLRDMGRSLMEAYP